MKVIKGLRSIWQQCT